MAILFKAAAKKLRAHLLKSVYTYKGFIFTYVPDYDTIPREIWKKVPRVISGGRCAYVSNYGRFCSHTQCVYTPVPYNDEMYAVVSFRGKNYYFHRIVHIVFGPPPPSPEHKFVNHIDLDKSNNVPGNLEWVTAAENSRHSFAVNNNRQSKTEKMSKPIEVLEIATGEITLYESGIAASRALGVNCGTIVSACNTGNTVQKRYKVTRAESREPPVLPGEEWKVCGALGQEISSLGRYKDSKGIVKTPRINEKGYCYVGMDGQNYVVHRLVADAFLPAPLEGQSEVNHINRIRHDNRTENLQRCTHAINIQHSYVENPSRRTGLHKKGKKVWCRRSRGDVGRYFESATQAAKELQIHCGGIAGVCRHNEAHSTIFRKVPGNIFTLRPPLQR